MEWIVQMGFELEIYQLDELAGMYWYVDLKAAPSTHPPKKQSHAQGLKPLYVGICSIWQALGFST